MDGYLVLVTLAILCKPASLSKFNKTLDGHEVLLIQNHNEVTISGDEKVAAMIYEMRGKLESLSGRNAELNKSVQSLDQKINKLQSPGYALLFPRKGTTDYVITRGMPSLTDITACFWMKSADTGNEGTPLSYSVAGANNEFLLLDYRKFSILVADETRTTTVSANDGNWHHICATWENTAGSWKLYKDGFIAATGQGLKKGHVIRAGGTLVIGQDQDTVGGSFQDHQSFMGELADVNIWNYALYNEEISRMSKSCFTAEGNVFKWADLKLRTRGGVQFITPTCNH